MKIKRPVRNETFTVTCTAEEKKEIFRRAAAADRTVSSYIRWLIKQVEGGEDNNGE